MLGSASGHLDTEGVGVVFGTALDSGGLVSGSRCSDTWSVRLRLLVCSAGAVGGFHVVLCSKSGRFEVFSEMFPRFAGGVCGVFLICVIAGLSMEV